uniref:histidine kinase n=1 Tax=Caldisericum exile TaxID=693075 RepID=A0A7C4TW83_9BACT
MWKVHPNHKGGRIQILRRTVNPYILISILLVLIGIAFLPVKGALGLTVFFFSSEALLLIAYLFIEKNEREEIRTFLKNLLEGKPTEKFIYKSPHFEDIKKLLKDIEKDLQQVRTDYEETKNLFNTLYLKIEEGVIILDKNGKILFKNEQGEHILKLKERAYFYEAIRNSELMELISSALKEQREKKRIVEVNDSQYEVSIIPIEIREEVHLLILFKKVKELEKETIVKIQFLEAVSHEMKTPLSSILGTVEIIEEEKFVKKKGEKFLNILKENALRLQKLTERVLKLSEIETGRNALNEVIDLSRMGASIFSKYEERFKEKGVDLKLFLDKEVLIKGNRFFIEDVLVNLIENAYKYTEKGDVRLSIKKYETKAVIEVEDTGRGIKEENIEKIFEPFYREDTSRNENIKGTGLGLTITKRIVELHRGKIYVKSKLGAGTKFTIEFPLYS